MNEQSYIERYWRDAKPEDAIKEPPMVARFRDSIDCNSAISIWSKPMHLVGWDRTDNMNWCDGQCWWKFCQVYDAPDPGEGWRLVDTENETKQEGDEYLGLSGVWRKADMNPFCPRDTYRRRITPAVTYVPFTWEDRKQLRGRIITFVYQNSTIEFRCESFSVYDDEFLVNDFCAKWLCKNAVFVDKNEPVGKKVAQ